MCRAWLQTGLQGVVERELEEMILHNSTGFYLTDSRCPLSYEPSGFDFLSPCLQTADLMVQVRQHSELCISNSCPVQVLAGGAEYRAWLQQFLPQLLDPQFTLEPGRVVDRTDGKLVNLTRFALRCRYCLGSSGRAEFLARLGAVPVSGV